MTDDLEQQIREKKAELEEILKPDGTVIYSEEYERKRVKRIQLSTELGELYQLKADLRKDNE